MTKRKVISWMEFFLDADKEKMYQYLMGKDSDTRDVSRETNKVVLTIRSHSK